MTNDQSQPQNEVNEESILWEVRTMKGFWKKKQVGYVAITNTRIIIDDSSIPLTNISEVAVINKHHVSGGVYTGYNVRSGSGYSRVGTGSGNYSSTSKTVGDMILVTPIGPDAIIRSCADPLGLRSLILSLRNGLLQNAGR